LGGRLPSDKNSPARRREERAMFCVIFEVRPRPEQWDAYLGNAKILRPELERVDGFIDNIRYKSLTRDGWILSLSSWRDEKSLVRWRTAMRHHVVQEKGRSEILLDYHLRVGEISQDSQPPAGQRIMEQRFDETVVGEGTTVMLTNGSRSTFPTGAAPAAEIAAGLGLNEKANGLVRWDVYEAVLTPGDLVLMTVWKTKAGADVAARSPALGSMQRLRLIRVVRDYGMFDRREAPQYYPPLEDGRSGRSGGG
jgi:heme-degrading monooxygenase HmoA